LVINTKNGHVVFVWAAYMFISLTLILFHYFINNLDVRVITYFPAFYLGIITAIKGEGYIKKGTLLFLFFIGLSISFSLNQNYLPYDWLLSTLLVSTGSYFIFVFFKNKINPPKSAYFPITALAYSSYCMYLFHRPIYMVLRKLYSPNYSIAQILYLVLFCLPCILVFSYYIQKFQDIIIKSLTKRSTGLVEARR
jgi:peptidoglycan/LPS O-acetylase OafA/YrhL